MMLVYFIFGEFHMDVIILILFTITEIVNRIFYLIISFPYYKLRIFVNTWYLNIQLTKLFSG